MSSSTVNREALISSLRREVEKLEGGRAAEDQRRISTGVTALDRLLPGGGLARGTLVEYLSGSAGDVVVGGGGAATLSLGTAREACGEGRALVVVERESSKFKVQSSKLGERRLEAGGQESMGRFYPPAAAAWGIDLSALLVLRTANEADAVWAFDQALRCPGVGAVWGVWDRLDVRDFRRLQLAAEVGGTIGLLIRPARLRRQPTWAEARFLVSPRSMVGSSKFKVAKLPAFDFLISTWRLEVAVVRCRGAADGQKVVLELDEMSGEWREVEYESAHSLSVFAELADSTARRA
jgi:protein ImuA